jgi:carbamoyltransferase
MLLVAEIKEAHQLHPAPIESSIGLEKLKQVRSDIPAVTHVDNSARIQTVNESENPKLYQLLIAFYTLTGCPVMVNTSFNVRDEPIVCSPEDAVQCFLKSGLDYLAIENFLVTKSYNLVRPSLSRNGVDALTTS